MSWNVTFLKKYYPYIDEGYLHDGHIPTPYHHDIFPPGGNMSGGNLLASHDDGDLVIKTHVARRLVASLVKEAKGTHPVLQKR